MSIARTPSAPAWTVEGGGFEAFWRGLLIAFTTPGAVLFLTALGFGTLVRDAGLGVGHALFLSIIMYALPAQVMVVDQLQRGAALVAVAIAVTLTAVRLLPMTVSLQPWLRSPGTPLWMRLLAAHMIAITSWVEGNRRLPHIPEALRFKHFLGLGFGMMTATAGGAVTGYLAASQLPLIAQGALLFMTPMYFTLSSVAAASHRRDWIAIVLGGTLTPLVTLIWPDADMLIGGLVGGTVAYLAGRARP